MYRQRDREAVKLVAYARDVGKKVPIGFLGDECAEEPRALELDVLESVADAGLETPSVGVSIRVVIDGIGLELCHGVSHEAVEVSAGVGGSLRAVLEHYQVQEVNLAPGEMAEGFLYLKSKKSGGKLSGSSLRFQNQVSIEIP